MTGADPRSVLETAAPVAMGDGEPSGSPTSRGSAISISGLHHVFGHGDQAVHAVADIELDLKTGEFLTLVGPSGCGKSTLLRIMAGLLRPTSGAVHLNGSPMGEVPNELAMVFQKAVMLKWLTVEENILLPSKMRSKAFRLNSDDDSPTAAELLELVGLGGFGDNLPSELSGGMQQRAAIARALYLRPRLLVMDEPFGALDAFTRESMNEELLRIWNPSEMSIVFVTHDINEAVFLSDRIAVMSSRPGQVIGLIDVELPRPRPPDLRQREEFQMYVLEVRRVLESGL